MKGFISVLAWSALAFAGLFLLSVLASAGIATWEWAQGNTTPKAGWEGFPIMLILLTLVSGVVSIAVLAVATAYTFIKGPLRLPFSKKDKQETSNQTTHAIGAKRASA